MTSTKDFLNRVKTDIKNYSNGKNNIICIDDLPVPGKATNSYFFLTTTTKHEARILKQELTINTIYFSALESSDLPAIKAELLELEALSKNLWISLSGFDDCEAKAIQMGFLYVKL